ncbi:fimbrial biogenesis outer membrane usher protein [Aeromonas salmonicida]|uniref:fimbrial biogenesis outer membrane usher protein n=1 Tax=Aeromonas salmonicida TaxID=645 RepID=UPI0022406714|nr:fimbrial biogenesis outer membrane usher protein [Aeromonas salmonicida]
MPYSSFLLILVVLCVPAWATGGRTTQPLDLLQQAEDLPDGFADHFFGVPLAVRILVDGQLLGEGEIVLGKDTSVQLLALTDSHESELEERDRQRWSKVLSEPHLLGPCQNRCADQVLALEYSLENSQLSVLTAGAEKGLHASRYYSLPTTGSYGALLRHQLNLTQGEGEQRSGRYNLMAQGSIGQWTPLLEGEVSQSGNGQAAQHHVQQLYAEREGEGRFYRLGYFSPYAQGLVRQPTLFGGGTPTVLGVMLGDSDTLLIEQGQASTTPVYVTPSRPGMVEIYRDGQLINSQQVISGLQALDTKVLPAGIYEVELRVLEDGQVTERRREMIYKPMNWQNPDESWRFNLFVGQQTSLFSNWGEETARPLSSGVMLNHLLTASVIVGASSQYIDQRWQHGLSADWSLNDQWRLFGNLMATQALGSGFDMQALYHYGEGSLVLSHQQQRQQGQAAGESRDLKQSNLSLQQRLDERHSANLYLAHQVGRGLGADLGWRYNGDLLGQTVSWNLTVFDRPGSISTDNARDRGGMLSLSMNLGGDRSLLAIGIGSRTSRSGGQERNASLSYQQLLEWGALQSVGANLTTDSYGVGTAGYARFQGALVSGDAHLQSSSYNQALSGGINLDSTLAFGDEGRLIMTGQSQGQEAGMIVDVESDIPELTLRADDDQGGNIKLRPGRNLVPVTAYRSGAVQLDMAGQNAPSMTIRPNVLPYHLNKGGVAYHQVRVMKTVTVIGRLLDGQGTPLKGAMVVNHAGRTISEADGFFAVEMSEHNPMLRMEMDGLLKCELPVNIEKKPSQQEVILLGDLSCQQPETILSSLNHD